MPLACWTNMLSFRLNIAKRCPYIIKITHFDTPPRNKAKSGQDMRDGSNFNNIIRLSKIKNSSLKAMATINNSLIITPELSFVGIFPFVLRSLWNPITPTSQTKICSMTDSPAVNIYC